MKFKIPIIFQASAVVDIEANDLNTACLIVPCILEKVPKEGLQVAKSGIAIVDHQRLEEMYPAETNKMREDAMPYWEKKGWKEDYNDHWSKGNAVIENTFNDVGFGFEGTIWIGNDGKSGFASLESAIDWAEKHM